MARALIAVGAALALLVVGLALAVFLTRDEDKIQVDNLLSENFTREVATAGTNGRDVDLGRVAPFEWERVLIAAADAARGDLPAARLRVDRHARLRDRRDADPARRRGKVERFFDYRGEGRFAGIDTPFEELARDERCSGYAAS